MYIPAVFNKNVRLNPSSKEANKRSLFGKAKSNLRSNSRQMTKEEVRIQDAMFMSKLHESTRTIGIQNIQGFTSGYILHQKR
jgi:hypothetical protein